MSDEPSSLSPRTTTRDVVETVAIRTAWVLVACGVVAWAVLLAGQQPAARPVRDAWVAGAVLTAVATVGSSNRRRIDRLRRHVEVAKVAEGAVERAYSSGWSDCAITTAQKLGPGWTAPEQGAVGAVVSMEKWRR